MRRSALLAPVTIRDLVDAVAHGVAWDYEIAYTSTLVPTDLCAYMYGWSK